MSREMIINVAETEECRVAVVNHGQLEELYMERVSQDTHVGNIYKGKITNIEPSIQAAFVDFGFAKNGFLHVSDLHPRYFSKSSDLERVGHRKSMKERPTIQQCLRRGQEIIVQVTKEGIKSKGPTLTTYLAIPGKYLVLMPWMEKVGVSQKIEDEQERIRLKQILDEQKLPKDVGFIIRTAGEKASKRDLQADLHYLCRLWGAIQKRAKNESGPSELYLESYLALRAVRDTFNSSIKKIVCDSEEVYGKIKDFLKISQPRLANRITYYNGKEPLFHKYDIESQIKKIQTSRVELKSGGSLVIDQTEALVAIDVNSGSYKKCADPEQTSFKINKEAAKEIALQLRLRDLGGLIICDFIDMREAQHRREIEKIFREAVRPDRAKTKILKMSAFGLIEMTRQRMRPSLRSSIFFQCPYCSGSGFIKSDESLAIEIIRLINLSLANEYVRKVEAMVPLGVADFLQNSKRTTIAEVENRTQKSIFIKADPSIIGEKYVIQAFDDRGRLIEK